MKRLSIVLSMSLAVLFMMNSCDELLDKLNINFETGPHTVDFEIQPTAKGLSFTTYDVVYHELKKEIEDNGGEMDQLDKVELTKATITILSGASNFNAFESCDVYVSTPTKAQKKIAWLNSVPLNASSLNPILTSDNLKDYLQESEYTITVKGIVREEFTQTIDFNAKIYFNVNL